MSPRCMSLLPRTTLHSDGEHSLFILHIVTLTTVQALAAPPLGKHRQYVQYSTS
jgi:hypothetical protein